MDCTKAARAAMRRAYIREWAAKTGRSEADVYVPVHLRDTEE